MAELLPCVEVGPEARRGGRGGVAARPGRQRTRLRGHRADARACRACASSSRTRRARGDDQRRADHARLVRHRQPHGADRRRARGARARVRGARGGSARARAHARRALRPHVLAGFSQGAAMALFTGTRHAASAARASWCSAGYEVLPATRDAEASPAEPRPRRCSSRTGRTTRWSPLQRGRAAHQAYASRTRGGVARVPDGARGVAGEIADIRDWLKARFKPVQTTEVDP